MAHVPRSHNSQQNSSLKQQQRQANDGEQRRRLSDKRNPNHHRQLGSQQRQRHYSNPDQSQNPNNSFHARVNRSIPAAVPVPAADDDETFPPLPPPSSSASTSKWVSTPLSSLHDPERMRSSRDTKNYPRMRGAGYQGGAVGPRFANKKAGIVGGTGVVNEVDEELAQECRRLQIDGVRIAAEAHMNEVKVESQPPNSDPNVMNWMNKEEEYNSTLRQCSILSAAPGGMESMPLGASAACYGVAKSLTEAKNVVEMEKLAVGNGRPRPSSLSPEKLGGGHSHAQANQQNGEFHQHPHSGPSSADTSPVRPNVNYGKVELGHQLEFDALASLGNGIIIGPTGMISVGCQTSSTVIQSAYSADEGRKGAYQIWFVPDYSEGPSDIRSSVPETGGYAHGPQENHCSNTSNFYSQPALHQLQPLTQAQFEASTETTGVGSDVPIWYQHNQQHQHCQVGVEEMKREYGTGTGTSLPSGGTAAPQYSHSAASSYNSNLSFESVRDIQSLGSPSSGNEYLDQTTKTNNLVGPSPRHLQNGPGEQEHLMVPQAQGCSNGNSAVDVDADLNRIALQMLAAGFVPDTAKEDIPGPSQNSSPRGVVTVGQQRQKQHYFQRKFCRREGPVLTWRGELLPKDSVSPFYSEKIFVGGIPHALSLTDVLRGFEQFGAVDASWCALGGDKIIPGCAYVILKCKRQVVNLLHVCTLRLSEMKYWSGQLTFRYALPTPLRMVMVEVIPWDVFQGEYLCEEYRLQDVPVERRTYNVFLGNLHARFSAKDLARFFIENGCQDVKSIKIGMDKHEYPVGFAKVAFGTRESFIHTLRSRVFIIETPEFYRRLQIEPFIEGNPCNFCHSEKATMFCRNRECYNYYCQECYKVSHGQGDHRGGTHRGDVVIRTRRSNKNCSGSFKDVEHLD